MKNVFLKKPYLIVLNAFVRDIKLSKIMLNIVILP